MPTYDWDVHADAWYCDHSSLGNTGNGIGPRLQSGRGVATDTFDSRFGIGFQEPAGFDYGETVVSATVYLKVRAAGGCWTQGSAPKLLIRRPSDPDLAITENGQGTECTISSSGVASTRYPGPTTTATDQKFWQGTPSSGDVISMDVTDLFNAWVAAKAGGTDKFALAFWPSNSTGTDEEQIQARKIAFSSSEAGDPIHSGGPAPYLRVITSSPLNPPNTPTLLTPSTGSRVSLSSDIVISGTYSHPDGVAYNGFEMNFAGSNALDGNGKLSTDVRLNEVVTPALVAGVWSWDVTPNVFSPAMTRGNTYYWQARTRDVNGQWSAWSAVRTINANRLPVVTIVRPA